jgi:hypothetical protein
MGHYFPLIVDGPAARARGTLRVLLCGQIRPRSRIPESASVALKASFGTRERYGGAGHRRVRGA